MARSYVRLAKEKAMFLYLTSYRMKTRIIHTKIWKDKYFSKLNRGEKLMFVYLLSNENANLCGTYEINDMELKLWLGLPDGEIEKTKQKFTKDGKFIFVSGWVRVIHHLRYNANYKGEKNEVARKRELSYVSPIITKEMDRLSIGYRYPNDSPINHKSEIINHKSKTRDKKESSKTKKYLSVFNEVFGTKYTSTSPIEPYLEYWLKEYGFADIERAVRTAKEHHYWKDKMTPILLLRKNKDWIGELLNYKPRKAHRFGGDKK